MFNSVLGSKAWQTVAEKMIEKGHMVDKTQVANKWKYSVNTYNAAKEMNGKSGNSPATCPFYEELDRILAPQPNITPVALSGNRLLGSSAGQTEITENTKRSAKKRKGDEPDWVSTLREEAREREEARKKRHEDSMALKQNMLVSYENLMKKLIEKL